MNFRLLFVEEADQLVVLLDGLQRLEEDCLTAGAGAVDDTLHSPFLLGLNRNDKPFTADGYDFVLSSAAFGEMAQVAAERVLDRTALFLDITADAGQLRRRGVFGSAVGLNLVTKETQKFREIEDA